jgi:hypothetical protein
MKRRWISLVVLLVSSFWVIGATPSSSYTPDQAPFLPVLVISPDSDAGGFLAQAEQHMRDMNLPVERVADLQTGRNRLEANGTFGALLLDTDLFDSSELDAQVQKALTETHTLNDPLPIFLISGKEGVLNFSGKTLTQVTGFIHKNQDTAAFETEIHGVDISTEKGRRTYRVDCVLPQDKQRTASIQ